MIKQKNFLERKEFSKKRERELKIFFLIVKKNKIIGLLDLYDPNNRILSIHLEIGSV